MANDFNKTPPSDYDEDTRQKKRIPVYILILVGIFLLALLFYMFADIKPTPKEAPPDHPNPAAEPATMNNTAPAQAEEGRSQDLDQPANLSGVTGTTDATAEGTAGGMDVGVATDSDGTSSDGTGSTAGQ
ncbi:hypothetical protein [Acinetobacter thermotolerans]|uniref:hypothetical protein n=1 Tax=Acinetobacter thermotolerans TaxID=3151487 RepID=UPI00325C15CA